MKKINQKGFSILETTLIFVIIGLLGGMGYFAYNSQKNKTNTSAKVNQEKTSADSSAKTVTETKYVYVKDNQKYLQIKEFGISIPLDTNIEEVVYVSGPYNIGGGSSPDAARLGLLSLGSQCSAFSDAASAPMGWYVRFTQRDVDAEDVSQVIEGNTSLHELMKTAVEIPNSNGGYGSYYVAYAKPTSDCSEGVNTITVNAASTSFKQALLNIKSGE